MDLLSLSCDRGESRKKRIRDKAFFSESLRIIEYYLRPFSMDTSAASLQQFVRHMSAPRPGQRSGTYEKTPEDVIVSSIDKARYQQNHKFKMDGLALQGVLGSCPPVSYEKFLSDERKILFVEEIRSLLLSTLIKRDVVGRSTLKTYHMYAHLAELSLSRDKSLFEKVNEFLNTNFKLRNDDILGHALRGNFGEIIRCMPGLTVSIEELLQILRTSPRDYGSGNGNAHPTGAEDSERRTRIAEWIRRHEMDGGFYQIFCGEYVDFSDGMERACYELAYKGETTVRHDFLEILGGDLSVLLNRASGWLKLFILLMMTDDFVELREFEKLFEELFAEIFDLDYLTAFDYLSYSRACEFHFYRVLDCIPLNGPTAESLIRYAFKNRIDPTRLQHKYAAALQSESKYDHLCRFILTYSIRGLRYSRDFVTYFVRNFEKLKFLKEKDFLNDAQNLFIYKMANIHETSHEDILFLMSHGYGQWFTVQIIERILDFDEKDEKMLASALVFLLNSGEMDGTLFKDLKCRIIDKIGK